MTTTTTTTLESDTRIKFMFHLIPEIIPAVAKGVNEFPDIAKRQELRKRFDNITLAVYFEEYMLSDKRWPAYRWDMVALLFEWYMERE